MRIQDPRLRLALFFVAFGLVAYPILESLFPFLRLGLSHIDMSGRVERARDAVLEPPLSPERHFAARALPGTPLSCDRVAQLVATASTTRDPVIDLTCEARGATEARRLAESMETYFAAPFYFYLRPPWVPDHPLTEAEEKARATYWLATYAASPIRPTPGNVFLRRSAHTLDPDVERAVAELPESPAPPPHVFQHGAALGRWMGQLELVEEAGRPRPKGPLAYSATGRSGLDGARLALGWVIFEQLETGLPALARHLCASGCTDLRVAISEVP